MKYVELTIYTTSEAQELISSKLWEYTSYGVSICDKNDIIELINDRHDTWDYLEDSVAQLSTSEVTLIKCYLDIKTSNQIIKKIQKELFLLKENCSDFLNFGSLETTKRVVDGDDWIEIWRKHYRPKDMGKVVIKPKWVSYEKKEGQVLVEIDSNMAFGTGEHETTSMCIEFLQLLNLNDKTVLDVGTGSGILGITAVKLGAKKCIMTDIDKVAVETAIHNAKLNGVFEKTFITLDNLLSSNDKKGDVVVANITADILCILAKDIKTHFNEKGVLILSGILKEKAEQVVNVYTALNFKLINSKNEGEWVALMMEKL